MTSLMMWGSWAPLHRLGSRWEVITSVLKVPGPMLCRRCSGPGRGTHGWYIPCCPGAEVEVTESECPCCRERCAWSRSRFRETLSASSPWTFNLGVAVAVAVGATHSQSLCAHVLPWQARGFPESCMRRPPALPPRLLQGHRGEPQLGAELLRGWKLPEGAYAEASSVLLLVMDMWGSEPGWGAFLIPGLGLLHVGWTPPLVLHGPILASCLTCLGCI